MKKSNTLALVALGLLATNSHAAVTLSGVYDESTFDQDTTTPGIQNNAVDASGTFSSGTGGITDANTLTVGTFTPLVATAFANNTGGVVTFDNATDSLDSPNFTTSSFSGITVTFNLTGTSTSISGPTGSGNRLVTSGDMGITRGAGNSDFEFSSFTVTGAGPGVGLTHFGGTLIHRQANQTWNVSAAFSGGGTLTFSPVVFATGDTANSKDTFFGIVAPTGETITSVFLDGNGFTFMDDIAFITNVPEPSSFAMLFGGIGFLVLRRRRN